jgi:hypothetical protein
VRLRNVSPRGDLLVVGHGHVPFGEEFNVLAEHVAGLVHQAFGDDKNFEPADDEAKKAVADAQKPVADPEPAAVEPAPVAPAVVPPAAPVAPEPTTEESK